MAVVLVGAMLILRRPGRTGPNVVIYVADTLRPDVLGCYGNAQEVSPRLDRFAAEGALFQNAYAPSSWTRASMASLLTATHPAVHGAVDREDLLSEDLLLLSELLAEEGYATAAITTNPNTASFFGFDQGFDEFIELYERREEGHVKVGELVTTSDQVTPEALDWIDSVDEPFFLLVLTIDPHSPYEPPAHFDRFATGITSDITGSSADLNRPNLSVQDKQRILSLYFGETAFNDDSFGLFLEGLEARELTDSTAVVFTSDHGEEFWEHEARGHGKTLFEETLRVPLLVRYPARVEAGSRIERLVQLVDVFPTVCDLAGIAAPAHLQGESLLAGSTEERAVVASLRLQNKNLDAIRVGSRKLIVDNASEKSWLYDLDADPLERQPLPGGQARALRERLDGELIEAVRLAQELRGDGESAPTGDIPAHLVEEMRALGYFDDDE